MKITELHLPGFDPLQFLCKLGIGREPVMIKSGKWTILAWDPAERITWKDQAKWDDLNKLLECRKRKKSSYSLPFVGGLIGYLSYDLGYALHEIKPKTPDEMKLPLATFGVYEQALCFDGEKLFAIGDQKFCAEVWEINSNPLRSAPLQVKLSPNVTREEYGHAMKKVLKAIYEGEVYQLNYTYQLTGDFTGDPRSLFGSLERNFSAPCSFYMETPDAVLVSLSPETFVNLNGNRLSTCPIKGTFPRGRTRSEDKSNRQKLMSSEKEAAELNMITELLRNDLGRVSVPGTVKVTGRRLMQKLQKVWHTYSTIESWLAPGKKITNILESMLPGGSVTGCPKSRAMELIDELEKSRRGPYTGTSVVLSDDGSFCSSIIIRTAVIARKRIWVGVGGGIVADSVVAAEYEETRHKAAPFLWLAENRAKYWINGKLYESPSLRPAILRNERGTSLPIRERGIQVEMPSRLRRRWLSRNSRKFNELLQIFNPANKKARGVFETFRADDGKIFFIAEHLKRLQKSARLSGFKLRLSPDRLKTFLKKAAKICGWKCARLKIVCAHADVFIKAEELILDSAELAGASVTVVPLERRLPEAKALPYFREAAAHESARKSGFHEALLVDKKGLIREGAYSNFFWVEKGKLFTPGEKILSGITRAKVIELAKKMKIDVRHVSPTLSRLKLADEIFLTRTTAGVVPVVRIDDKKIRGGQVDVVTIKI